MNRCVDIRGMTPTQSWTTIKNNLYKAEGSYLTTVTDSLETAEYLKNAAESTGLRTTLEELGGDFYLHMTDIEKLPYSDDLYSPSRTVIVITNDAIGHGDEKLGKILLKSYIYQLQFIRPLPKCIIFMNKGVNLTLEGSESLECLKSLCDRGVRVLSSSTCLCYYNCKARLAVGEEADMKEITEITTKAKNTIVL